MTKLKIMTLLCMLYSSVVMAAEPLSLQNETGETLMFHRLNNGELWGSFMITDQVSASFADQELIVLQIDQNQPIKLDHAKRCGGGKSEFTQQVTYSFEVKPSKEEWQFKQSETDTAKPDFLKLVGWDKNEYEHMRSDRRPEVVDFPIQGMLAIDSLLQQFKQGQIVIFRYVDTDGQLHLAEFSLNQPIIEFDKE